MIVRESRPARAKTGERSSIDQGGVHADARARLPCASPRGRSRSRPEPLGAAGLAPGRGPESASRPASGRSGAPSMPVSTTRWAPWHGCTRTRPRGSTRPRAWPSDTPRSCVWGSRKRCWSRSASSAAITRPDTCSAPEPVEEALVAGFLGRGQDRAELHAELVIGQVHARMRELLRELEAELLALVARELEVTPQEGEVALLHLPGLGARRSPRVSLGPTPDRARGAGLCPSPGPRSRGRRTTTSTCRARAGAGHRERRRSSPGIRSMAGSRLGPRRAAAR